MSQRPQLAAFPKCYLDRIAGDRSMSVFDWIAMAGELPAAGLEMYDGFLWDQSDAGVDRVADAIREAGFRMPMLCCSPDFTQPDADARRREVDRYVRRIEIAHRLGGPGVVCRVLSGQRRPEVELEEGCTWVVQCIEAALPAARELGVVLGMENHYKDGFWDYPEFAQQRACFLKIVAAIGDTEHFGVQFDPSNAIVAGEDPVTLLDAIAERVVSMHASDRYLADGATLDQLRSADGTLGYSPLLRHGVVGQGLNNYDALLSRLAAAGYHGWISIEDGMNGMEEMRQSLEFLSACVDRNFPASHAPSSETIQPTG